nr:hypothetical protein CFP56_74702 [Quercus suber]
MACSTGPRPPRGIALRPQVESVRLLHGLRSRRLGRHEHGYIGYLLLFARVKTHSDRKPRRTVHDFSRGQWRENSTGPSAAPSIKDDCGEEQMAKIRV